MKKRSLKTLALNKNKVSELQVINGGFGAINTEVTNQTCSCVPTCGGSTIEPVTKGCDR
ncbi:hypothetical protein [uncultured Kordia sp.]|uniref:hypothetical protein n=1 Tax=uncultured Kordia sp. TaxID=507699 RepID=UPI0026061B88|nr:hypothetical protein [uncultured Kordia sp.]